MLKVRYHMKSTVHGRRPDLFRIIAHMSIGFDTSMHVNPQTPNFSPMKLVNQHLVLHLLQRGCWQYTQILPGGQAYFCLSSLKSNFREYSPLQIHIWAYALFSTGKPLPWEGQGSAKQYNFSNLAAG